MLNKIMLMGRLTTDPELKQTPNGISVATFTVAVDRNYQPKGQDKQTDFIPCVAWRNTAEFVSKYFSKGRMIVVEGALETRKYEDKSGNKRTAFEVIVDQCYFGDSKPASGGTMDAPLPPAEPPPALIKNTTDVHGSPTPYGVQMPMPYGKAGGGFDFIDTDDGDLPF